MTVAVPVLSVIWLAFVNVAVYLLNENAISRNWTNERGRTLGCTNRKDPDARPATFFCWDILDPNSVVSGVVPLRLLLGYRLSMLALFGFTVLFQVSLAETRGTNGDATVGYIGAVGGFQGPTFEWLVFFSNWTFVGFGLSFLLNAIVVFQKLYLHKSTELQQWTLLHQCCLLTFETVVASALFLSIFYWVVLYDGTRLEFDNLMRHAINIFLLLLDLVMSRFPLVTYHFQVCLIYGSVYAVFLWIYSNIADEWVYSALDWNANSSLVYYFGVPFILLFAFAVAYGVASLRERFLVSKELSTSYSAVDIEMPQL